MNSLLYILAIICAVWVLVDVWTKQRGMSTGIKLIWSIFALLFSILTAIIYYFMKKK